MSFIVAVEAGAAAPGTPVPGISHDALLIFLLQFLLLLLLARGLGILATRVGMPSVVGELLAGLLLGPTVLGGIAPGIADSLFPAETSQAHLLEIVSFIGVMLLLILTGLETDLKLIASKGRAAVKISFSGIFIPLALGVVLGLQLSPDLVGVNPDSGQPTEQLTFALFMGVAMAISAIPVIAKVFIDLKAIKRDLGQMTLAAAMIDDTLAWILLGIVVGIARSGGVRVGGVLLSIGTVLTFLLISYTVGRVLVTRSIRWVSNNLPGDGSLITTIVVFALAFAAFAQFLEVEAVLGAFVVGVLMGQITRVNHHVVNTIEVITLSVFAPVFFASAGLKVNLRSLADPRLLGIGLVVLAIAILGKFAGAFIGAKWARLGTWEALSLGAGMNARGAVEIIIATIGLNLGVLSTEMFTIIVMVAIVTSLMAPPILRFTIPRVPYTDAERERLAREASSRVSLLGNVHRVLLPTRGGTNSQLTAQLLQRMAVGSSFEVTIMQVATPEVAALPAGDAGGSDSADLRFTRVEGQLGLRKDRLHRLQRDMGPGGLSQTVLDEARRGGYDLIAIGATEMLSASPDSPLFSGWVDEVLQASPVPVLLVSSRFGQDATEAIAAHPMHRILLPSNGAEPNRSAAEIAFEIAGDDQAMVDVIHVFEPPTSAWSETGAGETDRARQLAEEVLAAEATVGLAAGALLHTEAILTDVPFSRVVVDRARETDADLVVLQSQVRPISRRAFLGHDVDDILRRSPCPVAVITRT
ncbi:MAG TPA: cation:proton antiporter [Euzebya sp.]|nr:cation:proton antiporter [Euzebya sp.]